MKKRAVLQPPSSQNATAAQKKAKRAKQEHLGQTKPSAAPARAKRNETIDTAALALMQGKCIQAEWTLPMFETLLKKQHKWEENSMSCYLACKAALLASGAEDLRQSCFLGYGPFSVNHFQVDRPQERENGKENQERSHVKEHVAAIDAATEVLLVLHVGDPEDGHYFLLQHCKMDDYVTVYQSSFAALEPFIKFRKFGTFIGLLMAEITGETRAKWAIKYKGIHAPEADGRDLAHCGPVAICAVATILSTEWDRKSTRARFLHVREHPRRQAVRALKSVVKQCYEKGWFDEGCIAKAAAATKALCGQDLEILERP